MQSYSRQIKVMEQEGINEGRQIVQQQRRVRKHERKSEGQIANKTSEAFLQHLVSCQTTSEPLSSITPIPPSRRPHHTPTSPFDVNLLDPKDPILFSIQLEKYSFSDMLPFTPRYLVLTSNSLRIYEKESQAQSLYGKPIIAIPLSAIEKVGRVYIGDIKGDERITRAGSPEGMREKDIKIEDLEISTMQEENLRVTNKRQNYEKPVTITKSRLLAKSLFEFKLKDEFLPIYTHSLYNKVLTDNSVMVELSPERSAKKTRNAFGQSILLTHGNQSSVVFPGSPFRTQKSIQSSIPRPNNHSISDVAWGNSSILKTSMMFEAQRRNQEEVRDSPSKTGKIRLSYIANLPDVSPLPPAQKVTLQTLGEVAKHIDKAETWLRSDQRLIFSTNDPTRLEEYLSLFNEIFSARQQQYGADQ
ncbi:hypothetical protein FGO68_gene6991 [Halteria grandinella]|uniref:Uncharacterized protein n=1 Tax=Halteria grandinella TaxID=5974 RepID=A0A8J8NP31_HALGN|nr:hypothetical protein FGO68_gene6991 [Halteria grandinella]